MHRGFFFSVLVFCWYTVVYSAIPQEIKRTALIVYVCRCVLRPEYIYMFLRRSLAHISYMYMIFVGTLEGLAPPLPKAGYATVTASLLKPELRLQCKVAEFRMHEPIK